MNKKIVIGIAWTAIAVIAVASGYYVWSLNSVDEVKEVVSVTEENNDIPKDWKTHQFDHPIGGSFTIKYPPNWDIEQDRRSLSLSGGGYRIRMSPGDRPTHPLNPEYIVGGYTAKTLQVEMGRGYKIDVSVNGYWSIINTPGKNKELPKRILSTVVFVNNPTKAEEEAMKKANSVSVIKLQNYSLVTYPLRQSPVYGEIDKESVIFGCDDIYWIGSKDMRLVKNDGEVLIPSLLRVISASDNRKPTCSTKIELFSAQADEKYLYLKTIRILTHGGNPGISGLYRLNLSNLTIKKLSISDFVGKTGLYGESIEDTYRMLSDGKSLIKWKMDGVYLVNLELDSKINLYTTQENQWLISSIKLYEVARVAFYNVNVDEGLITIGVYDKTKTEDSDSISVDEHGRLFPDINYGESAKFKLIKQITRYVPD